MLTPMRVEIERLRRDLDQVRRELDSLAARARVVERWAWRQRWRQAGRPGRRR